MKKIIAIFLPIFLVSFNCLIAADIAFQIKTCTEPFLGVCTCDEPLDGVDVIIVFFDGKNYEYVGTFKTNPCGRTDTFFGRNGTYFISGIPEGITVCGSGTYTALIGPCRPGPFGE